MGVLKKAVFTTLICKYFVAQFKGQVPPPWAYV